MGMYGPLAPDDPRHGTRNAYVYHHCHCELCRKVWADYHREYMQTHPAQRLRARERQVERNKELRNATS